MKALVKKEPMKGIWMEEVAMPKVGVNDVLIKIKKTAICGTDLHIYKWDEWSQKTIKTPMTIGHEYVGVVAEVGPGVRNIQVGDRVTGEGHIACGHCRNCRRGLQHICENSIGVGVNRDGAFAEYLCIPESNVVKLDDRISDDMAAIMDPLAMQHIQHFHSLCSEKTFSSLAQVSLAPWLQPSQSLPALRTSSLPTSVTTASISPRKWVPPAL